MPSLVYIAENSQNVSYPLGKGAFNIGSHADSSLQLPSQQIAPQHAAIFLEEGHYHLRDNNSESGSYVNGERVTQVQLKHHDILRFGEYRFRMNLFDVVEPAPAANPANIQTSRIDLPPALLRRATHGLPTAADARRVVVESRPHSLKSALTSQIEPMGLPKKGAAPPKASDSALLKRSTSDEISADSSPNPSLVVVESRQPAPLVGLVPNRRHPSDSGHRRGHAPACALTSVTLQGPWFKKAILPV